MLQPARLLGGGVKAAGGDVDTPDPGGSSVPEAQPRWRLVDGIALPLALLCFASALLLAMGVI